MSKSAAIMHEVVLIRPPMVSSKCSLCTLVTPPLAIAYLSGTLRAHGHEAQVIDALGEDIDKLTPIEGTVGVAQGLSIDDIVSRIDTNAKIIGFSSMFSCAWTYHKRTLDRIRKRFPKALIVAGGEHITACAEYVLKDCPSLDLCVRGEGEESFLNIVTTHLSGGDVTQLDGLVFRKNGLVQFNPPRNRIRDIDSIPEPYWDDLPLEKYLSAGCSYGVDRGRSMPLLATRGCPYECTFCSSPFMWTTRWVARSPKKVFEEMKKYVVKYKIQNFDFYDLTAIIRKDWILEFCDLIIASGLQFTWQLPSGTRSEAIDAEVVDKLWRSGCRNINYAPESGSETVLKRIKKKVKIPRLKESMRAAIKRGLNVKINMIFAFPEDTPHEMSQNYKFGVACAWLGAHDSSFFPYVPYPGAELYQNLLDAKKIEPMSDNYFNGLIPHADLNSAKSYNPFVKDHHLIWCRYFYLMLFYGTMFLRRPQRFFRILSNLLRGKQESQGELALSTILRKRKQMKQFIDPTLKAVS